MKPNTYTFSSSKTRNMTSSIHLRCFLVAIVAIPVIQTNLLQHVYPDSFGDNPAEIVNLMQVVDLNRIRVASIFMDDDSVDLNDTFLRLISARTDIQFQWNTIRFASQSAEWLPESIESNTLRPMASSQTAWFIVFIDRLELGRELCDHSQNRRLRATHHLSIVLVLNNAQPSTDLDMTEFLSYVWKYTEPMNLIAIQCPHDNCTAFRFYPAEGLTMSADTFDHTHIYSPQSFPAASRHNRPPNSTADQLIVKFDIDFMSAFAVTDVPREHCHRLVGRYVWTGRLLADMLNKRLHIVTAASGIVGETMFASSSLLDWMDRIDVQITYADSLESFNK